MAFNKEKALKEAEKLVAKGKDRDAIKLFEEVYKNDPRDLNSLNKVGDLYLKVGEKAAALEAYAKIADKYASDGFNLRAIAMYKKCQRVDPSRIEFIEKLAELNAQQGLTNEAKLNFQQVADHYTREGKGEKARQIYARISEIEPDNLKNRLKLADLYLKENKLQQALGEYRVIGAELAKKGMLDESLQVLEKALGLDGGNIDILRAIARTRVDMGRAEEGVRFIHTKLTEKGGSDPSLLLVLGETLQAAGHHDHARQAFERAQAAAPERSDVPLAFYRLCVEQGDADGALAQYLRVAAGFLSEGKGEQVVEDLKAILRVRDGHVGTLERILQVQAQIGADTKVQGDWMSRLAEGYIAQGSYPQAEGVLAKLVQMEPDVAQHAEKLEFVRMKAGSGMAAPVAPAPAAAAALPSAAETSFSGFGDAGDGFSMSFDDDEMDAGGGGDDRGEFITERSAEADVFIKYGLVDKALEQLQTVLGRYPDDIPTRLKLAQIHRDEGRKNEELEQLVALAGLYAQQGDAANARQSLVAAQAIAPSHPAVVAALGASAPVSATSGGFDLALDDDAPESAPSLSWDEPAAPAAATVPAASPSFGGSGGEFELSLESDEDATPAPPPAPAASAGGGEFELSLDAGEEEVSGFDFGSAPAPEEAGNEFEISMDEPETDALSPVVPVPATEEFSISMDADEPSFELDAEPEPEPAPATMPMPAMAAPVPAPIAAAAAAETEEGLFGEEDDFFNFADEINKEMEAQEGLTEVSRGDGDSMTLEEIVSGIQKGVAAQVDREDYETHYNLGIAYKEMGLADEAIGEFQYASKDPARFLSSCILLGACFTEKGMPELAVQWYDKAKADATATEEDRLALDYEIALCRQAMGEEEAALKTFMSIYSTNARYRDVSQQIARLKQAIGR